MSKRLPPMHPGEVLREEFLLPLKLSAGALARKMDVPRTRIERIAEEKTGITADTALRLSKALGTTPQLWLNLQTDYDLQMALRALGKKLAKIEPVAEAASSSNERRAITLYDEIERDFEHICDFFQSCACSLSPSFF